MAKAPPHKELPPLVVIYGDEEYQKNTVLSRTLDELMPPDVDRGMVFSEYDAARTEDQGGPTYAAVMDDLATLPFLADRRVVLIREADRFITPFREKLERYVTAPHKRGVLILLCRSFPATTRLYKAARSAGCELLECKKLSGRALLDFVLAEATARGKRLSTDLASRLIDLVGNDQAQLSSELEKLALYTADRPAITEDDIAALVGMSREEKIFAVLDSAAAGDTRAALEGWRQVLESDRAAEYKALGGIAFKLRRWVAAQQMAAEGMPVRAIAPKVMMWGRERELESLLRSFSGPRLQAMLAALADLDAQVKVGARSIESGVESLLLELSAGRA